MILLDATTTVTTTYVTSYCTDIVAIINVVITACGSIPSGSFLNITLIADILFQILCEINYTLQLLLSKCGLRMSLYSTSFTTYSLGAYANTTQ